MTPAEERTADQLRLVAAAIAAFGESVRGVGRAVRRFCLEFDHQIRIAGTRSPKERRRLIRDWQRYNRRPALIHNGRKPR